MNNVPLKHAINQIKKPLHYLTKKVVYAKPDLHN
ncbi:hypothetical protein CP10743SC13_0801A, partial [Chlamydia psittaci 10_743_SC13]